LANQKQEEASEIVFITLFFNYHSFVAPFTSLSKVCKHAGAKIIFLRQTGMF
jgi:hypothetical protein